MQCALEHIFESKYVELEFKFYDRNFPILRGPCNVKKLYDFPHLLIGICFQTNYAENVAMLQGISLQNV